MAKFLVTSALIYANGPIHLGHMAGAYLPADIFVRFRRLNGDDVIHISGTDDHGVPITIRAEKEGVTPREIVDRYHRLIHDSYTKFGISFDNYSGTSRPKHYEISSKIFTDLYENGHVLKKEEQQFYDEVSKRFLPDRYVEGTCPKCGYERARGDQCDKCGSLLNSLELINPRSALSNATPVIKSTTHWYLKLQDFEERLIQWIEGNKHWKDNVRKFILGWIRKEGLHERAITRDLDWGIPVPLAEAINKVLYVWFDAPIGYISSTVEWAERMGQPEKWRDYWEGKDVKLVHFIGKDNIPFHAVIWPAVLMGQNEPYILPYDIPANEYLTLEGEKISTSLNWAIWINEYLECFPPDPLRYFLAANAPETKDADFSWKSFQERNNEELANILGNFANRSLTFIRNQMDNKIPKAVYQKAENELLDKAKEIVKDMTANFANYKVREAVKQLMDIARLGNKYFDEMKPWELKKSDPARLDTVMNACVNLLRILSIAMYPILPFSAEKLWVMIGEPGKITEERWDTLGAKSAQPGRTLGELEILFEKYDDDVIKRETDKLLAKSNLKKQGETKMEENAKTDAPALISIDEFKKFDIRVAEIIHAEPLEKSKKLIKLKVKVGDIEKQILAGIKEFYPADQLVGKKIVILNNLEPATLMGEKSEGMLLAASNGDRSVLSLLTPDRDMESGGKIS